MNILDYIKGKRKGKEVNRFEREAMEDPFLQDAIDGYDLTEGNHPADIEALQNRIKALNAQKEKQPVLKINLKRWAIAASFAILAIGIGFLIFQQYNREKPLLTMNQEVEKRAEPHHAEKSLPNNPFPNDIPEKSSLPATTPILEEKQKSNIKPVVIQKEHDLAEIRHKEFLDMDIAEEMTIAEEFPVDDRYLLDDSLLLAINKEKEKENWERALSTMQGVSSTDGKIISVRGNRDDGQVTIVDGVKVRGGAGVELSSDGSTQQTQYQRPYTMNQKDFGRYVRRNFNKELCPELKGVFIITFSVSDQNLPENIIFPTENCEDLEDEIIRLFKESGFKPEKGNKISVRMEF